MTPEQIQRIPDPVRRAREAEGFLSRGRDALATVKDVRDAAIAELLLAGRSQRDVAQTVGVSATTVAGVAAARHVVVERVARRGGTARAATG